MRVLTPVLLLLAATLAGCATGDGGGDGGPPLQVDPDTGGIRGLVVDQAIAPIFGAEVKLSDGTTTETGEDGQFNFTGLAPGDYFVSVSKPGYRGVQATATAVAGEAEPPILKVLLERLTTATPYLDHFKLEGFYECAYGVFVQTDACDWGYRTVWDEYNNTQGSPPPLLPRTVQRSVNTQFIDVPADTWAIVQEAFWEHETVTSMMISLDETPIDNACDCSDSYTNVVMPSPTYSRLDLLGDNGTAQAPAGVKAAARGFIPFAELDDPTTSQAATNLQFVIITTLFHNYVPDESWTFETRDNFPVG